MSLKHYVWIVAAVAALGTAAAVVVLHNHRPAAQPQPTAAASVPLSGQNLPSQPTPSIQAPANQTAGDTSLKDQVAWCDKRQPAELAFRDQQVSRLQAAIDHPAPGEPPEQTAAEKRAIADYKASYDHFVANCQKVRDAYKASQG